MNSKAIIAIIAVVILVIAGGGVGIFFALNGNNNSDSSHVDSLKDDIVVGDYITLDADIKVTGVMNFGDVRDEQFIELLYRPGGQVAGSETLTYKGVPYDCTKYVTTYSGVKETRWIMDGESKVCLKLTIKDEKSGVVNYSYTLSNTNFDINLPSSEQKVREGSFIEYGYEQPYQKFGIMKGVVDYRLSNYSDGKGTLTGGMNAVLDGEVTVKIAKITASGNLIYEGFSAEEHTPADFLSDVSFDEMKKYWSEQGIKPESVGKEKKAIDTEFGKRNVTAEDFKSITSLVEQYSTITYGEKGVVYLQKIDYKSKTATQTENILGTVKLVNSSMIVKS